MAEIRAVQSSVDTVNAAAAAIVSAEGRVQPSSVQRRRWATWFSVYWCFGSHRNNKRIRHAILIPEPAPTALDAPSSENLNHSASLRLPFIAPPSSPVSIIQSGPPSAILSPTGPLSLSTLSASSYSPTVRPSIFATGPYANEPQLVSPPVFSTFTTEPSTAPITPPPESVQLTTPSSPEVPFARLLTSSLEANCKPNENYEFPAYQLYPGSPIGQLISPSSVCSGTSSPFPDVELHSSTGGSFLSFPVGEPPKILSAEVIAVRKLLPCHVRNGGSLLDGQISAAAPFVDSDTGSHSNEHSTDHRVSFELTAEEVARCLGKKVGMSSETIMGPAVVTTEESHLVDDTSSNNRTDIDEMCQLLPEKVNASAAAPLMKEFKFDNSDGPSEEPSVGSAWWANEKVVAAAPERQKSWTFFPMIQSGVS